MGEVSHVLKINSDFDAVKAIWVNYLTIKQGNGLIALYKDEAVKLAEWILENAKNEQSTIERQTK